MSIRAIIPSLCLATGFLSAPAAHGQEAVSEESGSRIGEEQTRSYVLEDYAPQRVPVRLDDPDSAIWEVNPHFAFSLAQRLQRPLLLLFTAKWNPSCMKLSEEVFATKSFNELVKEHCVICYLDYPANRSSAPPALQRWKEQFDVMGYPNLLVFDPDGNVVQDLTGYTAGKPVTYFNQLKAIVMPLASAIEEKKTSLRKHGFREWENAEGERLFARFVRRAGELVTLQGANQKTWTIEIASLSGKDQELIRSFPEAGEVR
ncbi:MAG: thioredoxin family protein [Verrucomicrobiae bacterium]|nr:thioredoxin family protein [Verrucomicrobiae bacterium]